MASVFFLHLTVAGNGFAMDMSGGQAAREQAEPGTAQDAVEVSPVDTAQMRHGGKCSDQAPCHVPGVPSPCPSLVVCGATAFVPAPNPASVPRSAGSSSLAVADVRVPLSHPSPPEFPPPRV